MGFKLMDLLKSKPPDKTKSDCVSSFLFPKGRPFFIIRLARVCVHYLDLQCKANETLWTVLMIKWCGAVLQTGHCPGTGCLFLWAKKEVLKSVKHLSLWPPGHLPGSTASTSCHEDRSPLCLVLRLQLPRVCSGFSRVVMTRHFCSLPTCQPKDAFPKRTLFTSVGWLWSFFPQSRHLNCTTKIQRDHVPRGLYDTISSTCVLSWAGAIMLCQALVHESVSFT